MATLGVHSGLVTFIEGSDEPLGYRLSRTSANSAVRSLRLDKLGVTGSSPVPPICEDPAHGGVFFAATVALVALPGNSRRELKRGHDKPLATVARAPSAFSH